MFFFYIFFFRSIVDCFQFATESYSCYLNESELPWHFRERMLLQIIGISKVQRNKIIMGCLNRQRNKIINMNMCLCVCVYTCERERERERLPCPCHGCSWIWREAQGVSKIRRPIHSIVMTISSIASFLGDLHERFSSVGFGSILYQAKRRRGTTLKLAMRKTASIHKAQKTEFQNICTDKSIFNFLFRGLHAIWVGFVTF